MPDPKVLIVMPAYCTTDQDREWIVQAVESVLAQTFPGWVLAIADSAPIEQSVATREQVFSRVSREKKRVRFSRFERRITGDVASKVNKITHQIASQYIVVLSHDDVLYPWYLEKQLARLDADPKMGFCQFHVVLFGERTGYWQIEEGKKPIHQIERNQFSGACVMRRDLFDALGGYVEELCPEGHWTGLEDYNLLLGMLVWGWRYRVIPEPLMAYRTREGQASSRIYGHETFGDMLERCLRRYDVEFNRTGDRTFAGINIRYLSDPVMPVIEDQKPTE